jgi:hypothetical protein
VTSRTAPRFNVLSDFADWDDASSFSGSLVHTLSWKGRVPSPPVAELPGFAPTMPAALLPQLAAIAKFHEPIEGLAMREVPADADVFEHLFGATAHADTVGAMRRFGH